MGKYRNSLFLAVLAMSAGIAGGELVGGGSAGQDDAALKAAAKEQENLRKKQEKEAENLAKAEAKKAEREKKAAERKAEAEKKAAERLAVNTAKNEAKAAKELEREQKKANREAAKTQAKEARKSDEQNGVVRPKVGTQTGEVWATADSVSAATQQPARIADLLNALPHLAEATVRTQYARWRKYYGISGRLAAPATPAAETDSGAQGSDAQAQGQESAENQSA